MEACAFAAHDNSMSGAARRAPIDLFGSTTARLSDRTVQGAMTFTDLLVASTPIILLIVCFAWRGIPTLIEWRRERKYQVEWHRTFRDGSRRSR